MRFNINKLILWLKSGKTRELEFFPNKINVITGESGTGKTDIQNIIYYCLFFDEMKITESIINENVEWYGIKFEINDKHYTICRKSLINNEASNVFYFSSLGEIPASPIQNNTKDDLKKIIETEFSISKDTKISYGGKEIKNGSKISMNYFLLFNLIDVSVIENKDIYFPFDHNLRYKEAIERILNLSLGIETVDNVLKREKETKLKDEIKNLERKKEIISNKEAIFNDELKEIIIKSKSYNLIDEKLSFDDSLIAIQEVINNRKEKSLYTNNSDRDVLSTKLAQIIRKKKNLEKFQNEYKKYNNIQKTNLESLKPIEYLLNRDAELLKTSFFEEIINEYTNQIKLIKQKNGKKNPINVQILDYEKELEKEEIDTNQELELLPQNLDSFESEKEKIFFIGQVKSKFDFYKTKDDEKENEYSDSIKTKKLELDQINVLDIAQKREISKTMLEQYIKNFMNCIENSLDNYKEYLPCFDFKNRQLKFINPKTSNIETLGSSSNHMFLQLFFTLSIHQLAFENKSVFLAPFLIIDQPSRPYFGTTNKTMDDHSDEAKIKNAFNLLNSFINDRIKANGSFQMIVFEHIPKDLISNLANIHIVEEFIDGNALIHLEDLQKNTNGGRL